MKRIALYVLIGSVVVSALVGIVALLSSDFGRTEVQVLFTSLSVTGASILALACAAAWPRTRLRFLPPIGIVLSILGFGLLIVLIWVDTHGNTEAAWKTAGSLLALATAAAHGSLLSTARLTKRHAWALPASLAINALLTAHVIALVWETWDDDVAWRILGILSILFAAFTILVPVLQRMGRDALEAGARSDGSERIRFCPHCGVSLDLPAGLARCTACDVAFELRYASSPQGAPSETMSDDAPSA